jgi:hypothetical protein
MDDPPYSRRTLWVDQEKSVVLKEIMDLLNPSNLPSLTKTTVFLAAQFSGSLQDGLFFFSPPAGAKKVDAFGR